MLLLQAWLWFPALALVLSLGFGLLVDRVGAVPLRGAFLIPTGLAAIMVVARAAMTWDLTAELATPLVVLGGVSGLVLGRKRIWPLRVEGWTAAAALLVFAVYAAPVVLSGAASF